MHNGYYYDMDIMKEELPEEDYDGFCFMENTSYDIYEENGHPITAYDYLHGRCNIFAELMSQKYGYDAFVIEDWEGKMIHCYNTATLPNGQTAFIDARGITTDYVEFISEFEDWVDIDESIENTRPFIKERDADKISENDIAFITELLSDFPLQYKEINDIEINITENDIEIDFYSQLPRPTADALEVGACNCPVV